MGIMDVPSRSRLGSPPCPHRIELRGEPHQAAPAFGELGSLYGSNTDCDASFAGIGGAL